VFASRRSRGASESRRKDCSSPSPRNTFGRPSAAAPGIRADRLKALQEGFARGRQDPDLVAEAGKIRIPIRLAAAFQEKYATPAGAAERVPSRSELTRTGT